MPIFPMSEYFSKYSVKYFGLDAYRNRELVFTKEQDDLLHSAFTDPIEHESADFSTEDWLTLDDIRPHRITVRSLYDSSVDEEYEIE